MQRHPEVTRRLLADGHLIGNHSLTHQFHRCLTRRAQDRQTSDSQRILTEIIGRPPALYRPPWLLRTPTLTGVLHEHGLRPVSGEFCHPFEAFQPAPQRIARRALAAARPGGILIFHDGFDARGGNRANTVAAVAIVIAELRRQQYRFVRVDELLGVAAYQ